MNGVGEKAEKLVWKTAAKLPGGGDGEPEPGSRWWKWKDAFEPYYRIIITKMSRLKWGSGVARRLSQRLKPNDLKTSTALSRQFIFGLEHPLLHKARAMNAPTHLDPHMLMKQNRDLSALQTSVIVILYPKLE